MWGHGRWRPEQELLAKETQTEDDVQGAGDIAGPF